eukprot:Clim_evm17s226 gene=Clim_evmTU17s226
MTIPWLHTCRQCIGLRLQAVQRLWGLQQLRHEGGVRKLLPLTQREKIRELHRLLPRVYNVERLSHEFQISQSSVTKILKGKSSTLPPDHPAWQEQNRIYIPFKPDPGVQTRQNKSGQAITKKASLALGILRGTADSLPKHGFDKQRVPGVAERSLLALDLSSNADRKAINRAVKALNTISASRHEVEKAQEVLDREGLVARLISKGTSKQEAVQLAERNAHVRKVVDPPIKAQQQRANRRRSRSKSHQLKTVDTES